jgi:hypothetical protein
MALAAACPKPLNLDRGNGCLMSDVPNPGNLPIMPRLNGAPDGGHPSTPAPGFLMRRGFHTGVQAAGRVRCSLLELPLLSPASPAWDA